MGKSSASSGWGWGGSGAPPPRPQPPPHRQDSGGGAAGAIIAALFFIAIVAAAVVFVLPRFLNRDEATPDPEENAGTPVAEATPTPAATPPTPTDATPQPLVPDTTEKPRTDPDHSLEKITWTVATPATLDQLAQTWGIPQGTLAALNAKLATAEPLAADTRVVVHSGAITGAESVGPPNDGRLNGAIPFPEGPTWLLAPDRTRCFGTGETIVAVLAALDADAAKFPDAAPIQLGEISARKGGPIYGHQSHQAGRDIDIRLSVTKERDRFDPERNWFLMKTLIEGGEVVKIFLNRSQQGWLRKAAEADVGVEGADRYFAIINHEPGHTIHMHVRFRCPDSDHRCVAYSLDETDAEVTKKLTKLPTGGKGGALIRKKGKLPVLRPKTGPRPPSKKLPG